MISGKYRVGYQPISRPGNVRNDELPALLQFKPPWNFHSVCDICSIARLVQISAVDDQTPSSFMDELRPKTSKETILKASRSATITTSSYDIRFRPILRRRWRNGAKLWGEFLLSLLIFIILSWQWFIFKLFYRTVLQELRVWDFTMSPPVDDNC